MSNELNLILKPGDIPNGTTFRLGIQYRTGDRASKMFDYILLKAGGYWYMTGTGVPQMAGWGAIERWLRRDGRTLVSVDLLSYHQRVWPPESR
jgi:hypothetical protein